MAIQSHTLLADREKKIDMQLFKFHNNVFDVSCLACLLWSPYVYICDACKVTKIICLRHLAECY